MLGYSAVEDMEQFGEALKASLSELVTHTRIVDHVDPPGVVVMGAVYEWVPLSGDALRIQKHVRWLGSELWSRIQEAAAVFGAETRSELRNALEKADWLTKQRKRPDIGDPKQLLSEA